MKKRSLEKGVPDFCQMVFINTESGELDTYACIYMEIQSIHCILQGLGSKQWYALLHQLTEEIGFFLTREECVSQYGGAGFVILIKKERVQSFLGKFSAYSVTLESELVHNYHITLEMISGIYMIDSVDIAFDEILYGCMQAYYLAKEVRQTPFAFYIGEPMYQLINSNQTAMQCKQAMEEGNLFVKYQPVIPCKTKQLAGVEALVRWKDNNGLKMPGQFLDALKKNQGILEVDFFVLEKVCQEIAFCLREGMEEIIISLNLDGQHLSESRFLKRILYMLDKYEIPHRLIAFEFSQSVWNEYKQAFRQTVTMLYKHDIKVGIHDFGIDESSLSLLWETEIQYIKIPPAFFRNRTIEQEKEFLESILYCAHCRNIPVGVVGIESREELEWIGTLPFDMVQGNYLDVPLTKARFEMQAVNKRDYIAKFE